MGRNGGNKNKPPRQQTPKSAQPKKPASNQKRNARAAKRKELVAEISKLSRQFQTSAIVGAGAYNFRRAATGKYAARKRGNTIKKVMDIGGRSLSAMHQANSGDYLGAMQAGMKILGHGDYQLSQNSIVEDMTASQVPVMHSAKESIRFRHREFVMEVYSPANVGVFTTTTFSLNPGLSTTFPYLSALAQQFQEYSFKGLVFEFKSTSAVAMSTSNIGMGTVALAAQYRADAPAFVNKVQMMNEMWAVDGKPSDTFMLPIECAPEECPMNVLYVRGNGLATTTDNVKFYDLAKVTLACTGIPVSEQLIGELWVSYDVEFYKPQASAILDLYQSYAKFTLTPGATQWCGNATIVNDLMGFTTGTGPAPAGQWNPNSVQGLLNPTTFSLYTQVVNSSLTSTSAISVDPRSLLFPIGTVGKYMLSFIVVQSAALAFSSPAGADAFGTVLNGVATQAYQNNWRSIQHMYTNAGSSTTFVANLIIDIPVSSAQAVVTLGWTGFGSVTSSSLTISQINNSAT